MKRKVEKLPNISERGQAIILIALAIVGLVGMVGLVTDTGLLLINYGKLKRGVDAAAVAAAQQYRVQGNGTTLNNAELVDTAKNFLQLNQAQGVTSVTVHSCEASDPARPVLCNAVNGPDVKNRKLVEVTASADVKFGFLAVLGITSTTINASAIGEAASLDIVLVIDTSASMAYETSINGPDTNPLKADGGDDIGSVCNPVDQCQPMRTLKDVALAFVHTLYFPYDRVAVITMTGQTKGTTDWNTARSAHEVIPLTSDATTVETAIDDLTVYEPRDCAFPYDYSILGNCIQTHDVDGNVVSPYMDCPYGFQPPDVAIAAGIDYVDTSTCYSSNIGGALQRASAALTGDGDLSKQRLDSFWVVMAVIGGAPNATDLPRLNDGSVDPQHAGGWCPKNTWWPTGVPAGKVFPRCRDTDPYVRHTKTDTTSFTFTSLLTGNPVTEDVSLYDADDYTRDQADLLATSISGEGVTIYTVGLGQQIMDKSTLYVPSDPTDSEPAPAAAVLKYVAECAGEGSADDCRTTVTSPRINHGQFFNSPNSSGLSDIFKAIANNIATKISQ